MSIFPNTLLIHILMRYVLPNEKGPKWALFLSFCNPKLWVPPISRARLTGPHIPPPRSSVGTN